MLASGSHEPDRAGQPGQAGLRLARRSRSAGHVRYWDDVGVMDEAARGAAIGLHGGDEGEPRVGTPRKSFLVFTRRAHFLHRAAKKVFRARTAHPTAIRRTLCATGRCSTDPQD